MSECPQVPPGCLEGRSCEPPEFVSSLCLAGRYCKANTSNGGEPCPSGIRPDDTPLPWELATYCPPGLTTQFRGEVPLNTLVGPGLRAIAPFVCPAGSVCTNSSTIGACPAGYFCPVGAFVPVRCSSDWLLPSPELRCPAGSFEEGGHSYTHLIQVLFLLVLLLLALELLGALVRRRARDRRISSAPPKAIQDATENLKAKIAISSLSFAPHRRRSPGTLETPRVPFEPKDATADQLSWVNALSPEAAARMPRDANMRWVMAAALARDVERNRRSDCGVRSAKLRCSRTERWTKLPWSPRRPSSNRSPGATQGSVDEPSQMTSAEHRSPLAQLMMPEFRGLTYIHVALRGLDFSIGHALVLKALHADATQGQMIALMGESGSGKSTLLNILGGRSDYGKITTARSSSTPAWPLLLNERPFRPQSGLQHPFSLRRATSLIGFVPQAHVVVKELTVFENLAYASEMRAETSIGPETRMRLVEMALDVLGLQECRHFVCDPSLGERLSGGQMRRVGIGIELVCDPPIMLLDEPTSSLDAVNTRLVVSVLKGLAKRGVLVMASIHQPRLAVYEMFDRASAEDRTRCNPRRLFASPARHVPSIDAPTPAVMVDEKRGARIWWERAGGELVLWASGLDSARRQPRRLFHRSLLRHGQADRRGQSSCRPA